MGQLLAQPDSSTNRSQALAFDYFYRVADWSAVGVGLGTVDGQSTLRCQRRGRDHVRRHYPLDVRNHFVRVLRPDAKSDERRSNHRTALRVILNLTARWTNFRLTRKHGPDDLPRDRQLATLHVTAHGSMTGPRTALPD